MNDTKKEETIDYVTPYALTLNPELMGLALAKPWKRALALAIDALVVVLLSKINAMLMWAGLAYIFFKMTGKGAQEIAFFSGTSGSWFARMVRKLLRYAAIGILLATLLAGVVMTAKWLLDKNEQSVPAPAATSNINSAVGRSYQSELKLLRFVFTSIFTLGNCDDELCYRRPMLDLGRALKDLQVPETEAREIMAEYAQKTGLDADAQKRLAALFDSNEVLEGVSVELDSPFSRGSELLPADSKPQQYSLLAFAQQFLTDLGLGFGWAAMYFTLCLSCWKGQTLGKKMMGIRVVQLDNSSISMWEAFGRYGGYSAGLATGLLGFLQIFWDPNRQAVQDKIAATLVIDLRKAPASEEQKASELP